MKRITYTYNGETYPSEALVRQAIWNNERKAFGNPQTAKEWQALGVTYKEEDVVVQATLAVAQARKLDELATCFDVWREDGATLISSLGFTADADEKANDDVSGLVILGASATFMDANNQPHDLTIDQLKILQKEIIESGVSAYETKWTYRNAINSAETIDAVNAIEIKFEPKDFSN